MSTASPVERDRFSARPVTQPQPPPGRGLAWRKLGGKLISANAVFAFAFLYLPIFILIIYSFNASRFSAVWHGFTLDWYRQLFQGAGVMGLYSSGGDEAALHTGSGIIQALNNSLYIAVVSTAIATVIGTMTALTLDRFKSRLLEALDAVLYLPIVIPEITMGVSLMVFFHLAFSIIKTLFGLSFNLSRTTIIISHVAFNISFVTVVVRARLADFDRTLEEAAMDLGANEFQTFRRVTLPLIMPGIIGGALLAFTLSLDDYLISAFTAGVGSSTLPMFVYGMIKFTVTPAINAISTLMLAASIFLVLLSLVLQRR